MDCIVKKRCRLKLFRLKFHTFLKWLTVALKPNVAGAALKDPTLRSTWIKTNNFLHLGLHLTYLFILLCGRWIVIYWLISCRLECVYINLYGLFHISFPWCPCCAINRTADTWHLTFLLCVCVCVHHFNPDQRSSIILFKCFISGVVYHPAAPHDSAVYANVS